MASKVITENDLTNILNEVLPATPSEYRKLLWTNPSPAAAFAAQTISLDLSEYDEVEIVCRPYATQATYFATRGIVNGDSVIYSQTGYGNPVRIYGTQRAFTATSTGITFSGGLDFAAAADNNYCIPYKIYGIKYGQVAPPVVDDNGVWTKVNGDYVRASKRNGIVTVCGESSGTVTLSSGAWTTIGTLPVGYRPLYTVNFVLNDRSNVKPCWGQVETSGGVRIFGDSGAASNYWEYGVTFPVAD